MHLPKLEVLFDPILDESERDSKSSKGGCVVQSTYGWLCITLPQSFFIISCKYSHMFNILSNSS